jgi:Family of unknown function (DUF6228)
VVVRLADRQAVDDDNITFTVTVEANRLSARVDIGDIGADDDDLVRFFELLAADFHGWEGERVCYADHLAVHAEWHTRGHIRLTWNLRPPQTGSGWDLSVTTWHEAGEQMKNLAVSFHHFLAAPPA